MDLETGSMATNIVLAVVVVVISHIFNVLKLFISPLRLQIGDNIHEFCASWPCDHFVGKASANSQPTWPTQPAISLGSVK